MVPSDRRPFEVAHCCISDCDKEEPPHMTSSTSSEFPERRDQGPRPCATTSRFSLRGGCRRSAPAPAHKLKCPAHSFVTDTHTAYPRLRGTDAEKETYFGVHLTSDIRPTQHACITHVTFAYLLTSFPNKLLALH